MNRRAFQKLAETRLLDARALLKARRYDAAYYVAGYSVECALKACIAKKTRRHDFPPKDGNRFYQHDLEVLARSSGIGESFDRDRRSDKALDQFWELVKDWEPESRYELRGANAARAAARTLLRAIEDEQHGTKVYIQVLVKEQIDAGIAILDALRKNGFPISAAFWCRLPESGYWRLVVASRVIDRIGPLEGYKRLHQTLDQLEQRAAFSGSISLLSPSDPGFQRLREYAKGPGQFGVAASLGGPSNVFQDAYIYSL